MKCGISTMVCSCYHLLFLAVFANGHRYTVMEILCVCLLPVPYVDVIAFREWNNTSLILWCFFGGTRNSIFWPKCRRSRGQYWRPRSASFCPSIPFPSVVGVASYGWKSHFFGRGKSNSSSSQPIFSSKINNLSIHSCSIIEIRFRIIFTFLFFLRVEPTELPSPWFRDDNDQLPFDANARFNMAHDIQPSLLASLRDYQSKIPSFKSSGNSGASPNNFNQNGKIGNKKSRVTVTYTKPTTEIEMTTKTHSIGVSGCTMSPFPYDVCVWGNLFLSPLTSAKSRKMDVRNSPLYFNA